MNVLRGEWEKIVKFHTTDATLGSKIKRYIEGEKNNRVFLKSKKASSHKRNYKAT